MAQKNHMAIRLRKSGAGLARRIVSLLPSTVTPEAVFALPSSTACAPTMSATNEPAGDWSFGFRFLSITNLNVSAVTGSFEGGERTKPSRTVNV